MQDHFSQKKRTGSESLVLFNRSWPRMIAHYPKCLSKSPMRASPCFVQARIIIYLSLKNKRFFGFRDGRGRFFCPARRGARERSSIRASARLHCSQRAHEAPQAMHLRRPSHSAKRRPGSIRGGVFRTCFISTKARRASLPLPSYPPGCRRSRSGNIPRRRLRSPRPASRRPAPR